jgi:hypothetical protein
MWCPRRRRQSGNDAKQTRTRGETTKTDGEIRADVTEEVRWDPQITDPDAIRVAVLSMPALGPVSVRKRTAETIVRLVGHTSRSAGPWWMSR